MSKLSAAFNRAAHDGPVHDAGLKIAATGVVSSTLLNPVADEVGPIYGMDQLIHAMEIRERGIAAAKANAAFVRPQTEPPPSVAQEQSIEQDRPLRTSHDVLGIPLIPRRRDGMGSDL